MHKITVGSIVAFNKLADATWFIVLSIDGTKLKVQEYETNYAPQIIDRCYVAQVR